MTALAADDGSPVRDHARSTYIVVCTALLITALLASYLPARQVLKVDPVIALRND